MKSETNSETANKGVQKKMEIIGMVHLEAMLGYPQHISINDVAEKAIADALALEAGGVDAILIENTDDDPQQKYVGAETVASMTYICDQIKKSVNIPLGICVLFNDYKASLSIANVVGADFVRVPVFIEAIVAASGLIEGNPFDTMQYRHRIRADDVKIYADVQVKHAVPLAQRDIGASAVDAFYHNKADGLIVTGKFTGDMPAIKDLKRIRETCPEAYILIGSGTNSDNVAELAKYADAAIVGTYFKEAGRIVKEKVENLINKRDLI